MPLLTRDNVTINNIGYVDWPTQGKGREYATQGRVHVTNFDGESATCHVRGIEANYTVILSATGKNSISISCNCPQAAKARYCKHMVASVLAVNNYIINQAENHWQYRMVTALTNTPKRKKTRGGDYYILLYGLQREKYQNGELHFRLFPYKFPAAEWQELSSEALSNPHILNDLLDKDRSWKREAELISGQINPYFCRNLAPDQAQVCNLITTRDQYRYYYGNHGFENFAGYLPMLAQHNAPIFLQGSSGALKERITLTTQPITIEAAMARNASHISIEAGVTLDGKTCTTAKDNLGIVSRNPDWVLAGNVLAPVENPEALDFMRFFPLTIPLADEHEFRERFFRVLAEHLPVRGDMVTMEDVHAEPQPRLYLADEDGKLQATLSFGYADYEVDADPKAPDTTLMDIPDSWGMVRIHRRLGRELHFYDLLTDPRYGLKRSVRELGPAGFELRARTHPFDFMLHSIPQLTQIGFEIFGEEKLKDAKINRHPPKIQLSISSGIDWFELNAVVLYGDQSIELKEVRKAIKKGERYIKLADGSVGQIPEQWLERYKHLFNLAEETDGGFRVSDMHLPLVDELLEEAELKQRPADLQERRERLRAFEKITPQDVPQGFTGELRHYQKFGLDWLHFLREYRFGGVLADDMGLGKTIQVLAFLQSLKERNLGQGASILIVPKSLIANWQRESSRFTPDLRFLQYVGNTREKETEKFNEYDVILTTYGTMLRDIELLNKYRFNYAILDESQAIKNPLAQSAKASRLLQAEHRLVMTGTPVENNTFELWSQFAFLNPGMLGSMDYFKENFSTPIESGRDEAAAAMLRKLVFPFILRRTKEQVAPELPPRTERILYTDLEPAQRKLYTHTRDRYRAELMGLIETTGMNDARMKILEGLLRLRQICIHPTLVEPTYKGESAKFELLFETLETLHAEKHKALVFSQFVETLKLIRKGMDERKFRYAYLDGQTRDRQEQVDLFQNNPDTTFFLLSLKAGGVGLNLTAADYVIHLDPWWNPAVEMQAADRAHRIGQDKPVFVYKFIARETVEEKILQLQERKRELVEQLISAEGSFFKSITADDVKVLFS